MAVLKRLWGCFVFFVKVGAGCWKKKWVIINYLFGLCVFFPQEKLAVDTSVKKSIQGQQKTSKHDFDIHFLVKDQFLDTLG